MKLSLKVFSGSVCSLSKSSDCRDRHVLTRSSSDASDSVTNLHRLHRRRDRFEKKGREKHPRHGRDTKCHVVSAGRLCLSIFDQVKAGWDIQGEVS